MKKAVERKLTLSKETVASLEAGKLAEVAGGDESSPKIFGSLAGDHLYGSILI